MDDLVYNRINTGRKVDDGPKRKMQIQIGALMERIEHIEGLVSRVSRLETAMQHIDAPAKRGRPAKVA